MRYFILFVLLFPAISFSQEEQLFEVVDDEEVFQKVDIMPYYDECKSEESMEQNNCTTTKMMTHVAQNFIVPKSAKKKGTSGRVFVKYVVDTNGKIIDVEIFRGLSRDINKEAIRVVKSIPPLNPGSQEGKKVKVQYMIPINIASQKE